MLRKFEMSRIAFREHAHKGQIPGVKNLVGKIYYLGPFTIEENNVHLKRMNNMNDFYKIKGIIRILNKYFED